MPLPLSRSRALIAAVAEQALSRDLRVSIAVVDEGGQLQAFERMDGAFPLSARIAEAKAAGAALWQRDGSELADMQSERGAFFAAVDELTRLPIIPGAGSVVIRDGAVVVGAVGVSGATAARDDECARAGLAALDSGD